MPDASVHEPVGNENVATAMPVPSGFVRSNTSTYTGAARPVTATVALEGDDASPMRTTTMDVAGKKLTRLEGDDVGVVDADDVGVRLPVLVAVGVRVVVAVFVGVGVAVAEVLTDAVGVGLLDGVAPMDSDADPDDVVDGVVVDVGVDVSVAAGREDGGEGVSGSGTVVVVGEAGSGSGGRGAGAAGKPIVKRIVRSSRRHVQSRMLTARRGVVSAVLADIS